MSRRLLVMAVSAVLVSLSGAGSGNANPMPLGAAADCHAVKVISVRGSGDTSSYMGRLGAPIFEALRPYAVARQVDFAKYGLPYPAVGIFQAAARGCKYTTLSLVGCIAGGLAVYQQSKNKGRDMLRNYIRSQCNSQKLVLVGFSQGAHVIGDVLSSGPSGGLTAKERARVAAVVIAGDPRFNSHEGYDEGTYRVGRNGLMGARAPSDLNHFANRLKSWCRMKDWVCQSFPNPTTGIHNEAGYLKLYKGAMVSFILRRLGWNGPPPPIAGLSAIQGSLTQFTFSNAYISWPACSTDGIWAQNLLPFSAGRLTVGGQYNGGWRAAFTDGQQHAEPDSSFVTVYWNGSSVVYLSAKIALVSPYGERVSLWLLGPANGGCPTPLTPVASPIGQAYQVNQACFGRPSPDDLNPGGYYYPCEADTWVYLSLSGMSSATLGTVKILMAGPITPRLQTFGLHVPLRSDTASTRSLVGR